LILLAVLALATPVKGGYHLDEKLGTTIGATV
jgi:hypothetical protein